MSRIIDNQSIIILWKQVIDIFSMGNNDKPKRILFNFFDSKPILTDPYSVIIFKSNKLFNIW